MKEFYHFGIDISLKAGEEILNLLPRIHEISYKGAINLVTEADLKSEAIIKKAIRKRYPNHTILAEESGLEERGDIRWVIDPLDGHHQFCSWSALVLHFSCLRSGGRNCLGDSI